ncbi:hypothetical protein GE061_007424 [Apolygus lucorum]|uniref:Coiled-coil domain-containing protein 40 n=1 Tax=Apolygus lucorum TaxID=248454 RepID=A0A8S9WTJ6_APOLU|nr:hypothetical protein GE061_007424 [Apolygus lucorum]
MGRCCRRPVAVLSLEEVGGGQVGDPKGRREGACARSGGAAGGAPGGGGGNSAAAGADTGGEPVDLERARLMEEGVAERTGEEPSVEAKSRLSSKIQGGVAFNLKEMQLLSDSNVADSDGGNPVTPDFDEEVGLGITETEVEEWGFYDENEGQELEDALEESVERFAKDMEEFESGGQKTRADVQFASFSETEQERSEGENEDDDITQLAKEELKNRSAIKKRLSVPSNDLPISSVSTRGSDVQIRARQGGLLDLRTDGSVRSESSESEMTWPRTPMTEADEIIREYLPGLFADSGTTNPPATESVTIDMESPQVLESDNPMMAKFQEILKEHLLRQMSKIKEQITQIDSDTKRLVDESKLRADSVYREDKFVQKQREDIEAYRANIEQIVSQREAFEKELEDVRAIHLQMKQDYNQTKRLDEGVIKEREMLNDLVHKMRAYEAEKDQNLKTSQAVSKNQQIEKRKLAEEKMKQDILIWKLEKEIIRLNNEIDRSAANCKDMRDETSCLEKLLKKVEDDSLGLEAENKLLQSSIMKMYGAIKDCDGRKLVAQQTLQVRLSNYNMIMKNKAFWAHKLKSEYFKMERLEVEKSELLGALDHQRHKLQRLEQSMQQLEREVEKKHITLNLGEEERNKLEKEEACLLKFKHNLELEIDGKVAEADKLKNSLNGLLNEKEVTEKEIGYLQKEIRKLGEINRQTEEKIIDSELALAKALLDVERARSSLLATRSELENMQRATRDVEQEVKEATNIQRRFKGKLSLLCAKHVTLERRLAAKNRADPKNAIGENETSTSWAEAKMKRMQEALKLVTELTKKLSDGWFNLQNVIMKRKDDRARQIHQLNIKRKHCHTMESCKIRVERNISNVQHTITKTKKEISKEQRLFERWQGEKARASDRLVRLTSNNTELEVKFVDDVSEAEKEARHLEGEIDRLRIEIDSLGAETARLQSELLEAEKRKDLAEIAKAKIEKFQSPGGEIGQLKQEIHRMEVRYSHLKKAQEKLMGDLETCITRRDRLLDNAEAREVRSQATGKQWSRMQVQRKMADLRNKIQTLKRKNQMMNREQLDLSYHLAETREEYNNIKSGIDALKLSLEELERQMEEGQLHKHACLESTLYRQKRAKFLEDYKFGRYRCVSRTPGALVAEEEKQNHLMNTLRTVLDNLLSDFPQLNLQISQILNTLEPVFPERRDSDGELQETTPPRATSQTTIDQNEWLILAPVQSVEAANKDLVRGPQRVPGNLNFPLKQSNWASLNIGD